VNIGPDHPCSWDDSLSSTSEEGNGASFQLAGQAAEADDELPGSHSVIIRRESLLFGLPESKGSLHMIHAVIFDLDGVLTDSEPVINAAAIAGLREYGIDPRPEDFHPFVGAGEDRYIGGVAGKYGLTYAPEMKRRVYEIYLDILPGMIRAFPGAQELLCRLEAAGIRLAVASSGDRIKVEANLRAIGVEPGRFGTVVAGEDVEHKKPAPDIFLAAARRLGVPPAGCCVVEDAPNGIRAAKAAGMRCVAVGQSFPAAVLAQAGADVIRASLAEILLPDLGIEGA
jgi:HAD superfamily hydrolase (TIGR01509 family)